MIKTLYTGFTYKYAFNPKDDVKTIYWTDDKDALPPDIKEFKEHTIEGFSWSAFLQEAMKGERKGLRYVIHIKQLYYETPEE